MRFSFLAIDGYVKLCLCKSISGAAPLQEISDFSSEAARWLEQLVLTVLLVVRDVDGVSKTCIVV